jgi:type IV pilus assembly protein PilP
MKHVFPLLKIRHWAIFLLLAGCSGGDHKDLVKYMQDVHKRPPKPIEAVPAFEEYKTFSYSAAGSRSPFDPPLNFDGDLLADFGMRPSDVRPDPTRPREFLENFSIGGINMVGTIEKNGVLWGLVDDGTGNVHRVKTGNYMGRNHGRILGIDNRQITLVEIITDGGTGYLERPKVIRISEGGK